MSLKSAFKSSEDDLVTKEKLDTYTKKKAELHLNQKGSIQKLILDAEAAIRLLNPCHWGKYCHSGNRETLCAIVTANCWDISPSEGPRLLKETSDTAQSTALNSSSVKNVKANVLILPVTQGHWVWLMPTTPLSWPQRAPEEHHRGAASFLQPSTQSLCHCRDVKALRRKATMTPTNTSTMIPAIHFQRCDIKLLCPKVPLDQAKD